MPGVFVRIGVRLLAFDTASWHDWYTDALAKRSSIAYDH